MPLQPPLTFFLSVGLSVHNIAVLFVIDKILNTESTFFLLYQLDLRKKIDEKIDGTRAPFMCPWYFRSEMLNVIS